MKGKSSYTCAKLIYMSDKERIRRLAGILKERGGKETLDRFRKGGRKFDGGGYADRLVTWAVNHPGAIWADTKEAADAREWLRRNAPRELSALYWNEAEEVRKGIDRRFIPTDVLEKEAQDRVTGAMDEFGQDVFDTAKDAAMWVPGPVGTAVWLADMGADVANGDYGKAVGSALVAGAMGGAGRAFGKLGSRLMGRYSGMRNFGERLGNFLDDFTWNDARRADASNLWSRNMDARQRWGVSRGSADASGGMGAMDMYRGFGFREDVTSDSFDSDLIDTWLQYEHPEDYARLMESRKAEYGKALGEIIDPDSIPAPVAEAMRRGLIKIDDLIDYNTGQMIGRFRPGKNSMDLDRLYYAKNPDGSYGLMSSSLDYPLSLDITPFTDELDRLASVRDRAFDLMYQAGKRGKLSHLRIPVYGSPDPGRVPSSMTGYIDRPIDEKSLRKPVIHFTDRELGTSWADNENTAYIQIGLKDRFNGELLKNGALVGNRYGADPLFGTPFVYNPEWIIGHEVAHMHPAYNNNHMLSFLARTSPDVMTGSPHYGNSYAGVKKEVRDALKPKVSGVDNHDLEANEGIADSHAERTLMSLFNINDGSRAYTSDDILAFEKLMGGGKTRFGFLHPDVNERVYLLNNGWKYGGQMNSYAGGGRYFNPELKEPESLITIPSVPFESGAVSSGPEFAAVSGLGLDGVPVDPSSNMYMYGPILREHIGLRYPVPYSDEGYDNLMANEERAALEDDILWRQRYVESNFNDRAVSPVGARGAWQIMPVAYQDYLSRGHGRPGDLNNPDYNRLVREHVLSMIPGDLGKYWSDSDSDDVKRAKLYASYVWGAGNLRNYLQRAKKKGVDISTLDWIDGLKKDVRDYVSFVALNRDVPGTRMTREAFERAAAGHGYVMRRGGGIHIKPENRGKFTALKKRTGHSASWFKAHGTPAQRKMANFALNARKWKHADGGFLHLYDGETEPTGYLNSSYDDSFMYSPDAVIVPSVVTASAPAKPAARTVASAGVPVTGRRTLLADVDTTSMPVASDSFTPQPVLVEGAPMEMDRSGKAVRIPDRDTSAYFAAKAQAMNDELNKFDVRKLSRKDIFSLQQEMADSGYYTTQLSGKSKDEIKAIQTKLIQRGLLSNAKNEDGTYKEADGIVGDRTRAAWNKYNVDGVWGNRSQSAYDLYENVKRHEKNNWDNGYGANDIDQCATWVTRKFESAMGATSKQNGVIGNAWTMPLNVGNAGGQVLFNIYSHGFEGVKTPAELKKRTQQRMEQETFDVGMLKPGDVVGIFFSNSTRHQQVLDEGTTYNTHIGIVTGYDKDGMPMIEHNMGGKVLKERADHLQYRPGSGKKAEFGITTVSRPKGVGIDPYPFEMGKSKYEVQLPEKFEGMATEEGKEKLNTYMDSMAGAAPQIGRIYTEADMDAVQRIAAAVLERETGYMQNTESSRTGKAARRVKLENWLREKFAPVTAERKSSDLTKFKLSTLNPDERVWLGINTPEDLEDPANAGRASLLVLAKNYDYFARYAKENPQLGLTKQDIEDLTALSYNQGMVGLYAVGSSKDEATGERYAVPGKLEAIREAAASDEVVDDFSATKLGRVAKEYPALSGVMKEIFNYGGGERSTSYMNSARRALQNVRERGTNERSCGGHVSRKKSK